MITHIRVKNFKSWEDSKRVQLAPLTGFFGTNSSGKSSLLQMLLLLKQTVGKNEVLFFGDEKSLVNLGNFQPETSLVDDGWRILNEYKRYVNLKTRKGIGDLFVKTLLQNLTRRPVICTMVRINPLDGNETDFEEFPTTEALNDFDVADRKFIAVAIAYERDRNKKATILQALDRKWEPFREAFE